jgi:uncharacterized YccA/Bax inhibitor family protein
MSNPVLSEKTFRTAGAGNGSSWGAPDPTARMGSSITRTDAMTTQGTVVATGILFTILVAASVIGWNMVPTEAGEVVGFPPFVGFFGILGMAIAFGLSFRPQWARFVAPVYAVLQGLLVGSISRVYEAAYSGVVLQAIGATVAVFAVMLTLHATGILRVTPKFRKIIMGATMGIALLYLVSWVITLFGASMPIINDASPMGIGFSVLVAGLAAFNLSVDFDLVERGVKGGAPKYMEWYAGFALLVTIIWLYIELLRLLGKVQRR